MQGQPNAMAWDLDAVDMPLSGTDWNILLGEVIWDLQNREEYSAGVYIPTERGIYLCDPAFKFVNMSGVTSIEIGLFKGEQLYFIIASKEAIMDDTTEISVRGACMVDLTEGDVCSFRVRLKGTDPSATIYAGSDSGDPEDDPNDFTAWGVTFQHRLP